MSKKIQIFCLETNKNAEIKILPEFQDGFRVLG